MPRSSTDRLMGSVIFLTRSRDAVPHAKDAVSGWAARTAGLLRHAKPHAAVRTATGMAALAVPAWRRRGRCVLHPQRPGDRAVARHLRLSRATVPDRAGGADLSGIPRGVCVGGSGAATGDWLRTDGLDRCRQPRSIYLVG